MPGYTHLQQAQPIPVAHHLLAHGWAISRDIQRLFESRSRTNVSVLGAGALAGSSLPLDSHAVADELNFESYSTIAWMPLLIVISSLTYSQL
ncbi:MAG: hypothetical protein CM15mP49_08410 [Actinomycetota bacterium]|nr:MAG: hypothetical protein CM15mP49_08410 [Actinomycetota bacterium]